ncbi:MAG: hypothetical protein O7E55_10455 [Chloroflexi bacterium]|nr:hypothetical protein [Chloroflexota bacterium]
MYFVADTHTDLHSNTHADAFTHRDADAFTWRGFAGRAPGRIGCLSKRGARVSLLVPGGLGAVFL